MMDVISVATSAAVGLPAGTVLRGQVARMSVPSGEPEEMTCRECAAAVQRLPDRLTLPAYPGMIVLLALAAAADDAWPGFARALLGGLALGAAYLVLGLLSASQLGGGDIKLAGLIGLLLGWLGWGTLLAGASLGFVTAAAVGLVLLTSRRISRRAMISFGPYMLAGAFLAVLTGR